MNLRKQDGFTIVETLVAATIATSIAYASFSVFPFLRKSASVLRGSAACRNYMASNFARIESLGTAPRIDDPTIKTLPSVNLPVLAGQYDVTGAAMSPKNGSPVVVFTGSTNLPDIRTAGLFRSSVSLVNALYAANATLCTSGQTFVFSDLGAATLLSPPPEDLRAGFSITMQITPMNLSTRSAQACTASGFNSDPTAQLAPKGLALSATQADDSGVATFSNRNNVGYSVRLQVNFTEAGVPKLCQETRNVEYTADLVPPAAPLISMDYDHTFNAGSAAAPSGVLNISYLGEAGTTLVCRDSSTFAYLPEVSPKNPGAHHTTDPITASNTWVPCDRVTMCARQPLGAATTWTGATSGNYSIQSHWTANQLRFGCHVRVEAIAVDPAGNLSPISVVDRVIADP